MDKTLRDYLKLADDTHDYLDKFCVALSPAQLDTKILELQSAIKIIQSVAKRIADVSNITTRLINKKRHFEKSKTKYIDPYPTSNDSAVLRTLYPETSVHIDTNINIPAKIVQDISEIPVSNLYYVEPLKQFAINVDGVVIKGNLGNIVEYKKENSARCEYGSECKSFTKNIECPYYHDPEDFIKHNKEVSDKTRNYTAGSWIYSRNKNPSTYFARHLGSRDKLLFDLNTLKKVQYHEEISNREGQLIHDLILYQILHNRGLLCKYPHWQMPKL
jgi:hypothetical protein